MWVGWSALLAGLLLAGCSHVCPTGWEAGTTVGHSALFGQSVEATATLSGAIGKECRDEK